jgi:uncharacterized Zn finger protein (UPF0148 family)
MKKRIYKVGELCDTCGTPTVEGKDGNGYCKSCYIAWKNKQEGMQPSNDGHAPTSYRPTKEAIGQRKEIQGAINYKSESIRQAQDRKEQSMRMFACNRDAVLITTALMAQGGAWTDEMVKSKIEEYVCYLLANVYMETEKDYVTKFAAPF